MIWTYLRSCYGFDMRVYVGGVEKIYPARWFFCDPDALPFPSPHGAEASPWLKDWEKNESWGEVGTKRTLDRGINPGYPGQCFVGDPQWFIDGQVPAEIAVYVPPVVTPCCGYVPPASIDPRCPQGPPTCQPDYYRGDFGQDSPFLFFTSSLGRNLLNFFAEVGTGFYFLFRWIAIDERFRDGELFVFHPFTPNGTCIDSPWTLQPFFQYTTAFGVTTDVFLEFVSYDPDTMTGRWLVPPGGPDIAGEIIQLQWVPQ